MEGAGAGGCARIRAMEARATIREPDDRAAPVQEFEMPVEAVEIEPPDLSAWRRRAASGPDHVHTFASGRPGPHVMVSAVVHGNELCGAIVLDELLRAGIRPDRGRLTLAFMNVAAFERFDPANPILSRYVDEDFNRLWSHRVLAGRRDSVELRRARALRPVLDEVDFLLDLHSMQYTSAPLVLCGTEAKGRELARELGIPGHLVQDAGHAAGPRMRDYAAFADEASPRTALLVECGQHWKRETVAIARRVAFRYLDHFGVALPEAPPPLDGAAARLIEVTEPITVRSHRFRFAGPYRGMEVIERAGTVIAYDGEAAVATPYDDCVLVMPSHRASRGTTAVRLGRFVG